MYTFNLVSSPPYFLTWLRYRPTSHDEELNIISSHSRYTFFIIAYPVGVSGELFCQYTGLFYAYNKDVLSIHLPNNLNASFSFPLFIVITMLLYIPLFPPMYLHMFGQRKKVLGAKKED